MQTWIQSEVTAANNMVATKSTLNRRHKHVKSLSTPFNTKFVDKHETDRNITERCPLPVLAQRIHTRYELRQNYNLRIGRNDTGSIISITGKSSRIVSIKHHCGCTWSCKAEWNRPLLSMMLIHPGSSECSYRPQSACSLASEIDLLSKWFPSRLFWASCK